MDRRNFLKKSFAASILGALALKVDLCGNILPNKKGPIKISGFAADKIVYGGGLFNVYARNRDSVDGAGLKLTNRQLLKMGYSSGRRMGISPGTQYFC